MGDFGIGAIFSSIINAFTNLYISSENRDAQKEMNDANIEMQRETNLMNAANVAATNEINYQMNAENNATQIALAEKAYERSTASNQIQELVKAGLSEMQARQIVAGSGSAPAMPMPATTATVATAPEAVAPQNSVAPQLQGDLSGFGNALGAASNLFSQYAQDLQSSNGGFFGQSALNRLMPALDDLFKSGAIKKEWLYKLDPDQFVDMVLSKYSRPMTDESGEPILDENGFQVIEYDYSENAQKVVNFIESPAFKSIGRSLVTRRAWSDMCAGFRTDGSLIQDLRLKDLAEKHQRISNRIARVQESLLNNELQYSNAELDARLQSAKVDLYEALTKTNTVLAEYAGSCSEYYFDAVKSRFLSEEENRRWLAELSRLQAEGMFNTIGPKDGLMYDLYFVWKALSDCGLMHSVEYVGDKIFDIADLLGGKKMLKANLQQWKKRLETYENKTDVLVNQSKKVK